MARRQRRANRTEPLPATKTPQRARSRWWMLVGGLIAIASAAGAYSWLRPSPSALLVKARSIQASDPASAEALLFRSIHRSGGDYPEAQWELCELLARQSRWLEARGAFSQIRRPELCPAEAVVEVSQQALAAGEFILPEMALATIPAQSKSRAVALKLAIELAMRQSRMHAARDPALELSRLTPHDPFPWQVLTKVYQHSGEINEALAVCERAISPELSAAEAAKWREERLGLLLQVQDVSRARQELDELLRRTTATDSIRLKHAQLLRLEGDFSAALQTVEQLSPGALGSLEALMLRGTLQLDLQRPDSAVQFLAQALGLQPKSQEAHYLLARAYQQLGKTDSARKHLDISQELNRLSEQILGLENQLARDPTNWEQIQQLIKFCEQAGFPERANRWRHAADTLTANAANLGSRSNRE